MAQNDPSKLPLGTIRISFDRGHYSMHPLNEAAGSWLARYAAAHSIALHDGGDLWVDARFLNDALDAVKMAGLAVEQP
jgi:hypothetical protein